MILFLYNYMLCYDSVIVYHILWSTGIRSTATFTARLPIPYPPAFASRIKGPYMECRNTE